jgi:phosphoglycolate phosphatase
MYKAVLFDLDGTLADSAADLHGAMNRLLAEEGRPPLALADFRPHVSGGAPAMLGAAFGMGTDHPDYAAFRLRFLDHYEAKVCVDTKLFPGVPELLAALDADGIAWGIVTNKTGRFTAQVAATLGLAERAACIVSGDTTARAKPAPDSLLHACELTGVATADTAYVGDDLRDVQAAHAANMPCIAAAWGYLGSGPAIADWGADAIAAQPRDVMELLAQRWAAASRR